MAVQETNALKGSILVHSLSMLKSTSKSNSSTAGCLGFPICTMAVSFGALLQKMLKDVAVLFLPAAIIRLCQYTREQWGKGQRTPRSTGILAKRRQVLGWHFFSLASTSKWWMECQENVWQKCYGGKNTQRVAIKYVKYKQNTVCLAGSLNRAIYYGNKTLPILPCQCVPSFLIFSFSTIIGSSLFIVYILIQLHKPACTARSKTCRSGV